MEKQIRGRIKKTIGYDGDASEGDDPCAFILEEAGWTACQHQAGYFLPKDPETWSEEGCTTPPYACLPPNAWGPRKSLLLWSMARNDVQAYSLKFSILHILFDFIYIFLYFWVNLNLQMSKLLTSSFKVCVVKSNTNLCYYWLGWHTFKDSNLHHQCPDIHSRLDKIWRAKWSIIFTLETNLSCLASNFLYLFIFSISLRRRISWILHSMSTIF